MPNRWRPPFMIKTANRNRIWSRRGLFALGCSGLGATVALASSKVSAADAGRIEQPTKPGPKEFVNRAFAMRDLALSRGDQGYGALIVDSATLRIVGQAPSRVVSNGDPTAHAEMEAIRDAARRLGTRYLSNHVMYSSSKPCPMCEAAAFWANLKAYFHGSGGANGGAPKLCG